VLVIGQPSCDKSQKDLNVIAFVVLTAFSKQPMCHYLVNVKLLQHWICILDWIND